LAKYTLLQVVQKVMGSTDSDEVTSIGDTVESMQVADICEDVYYNLVTNNDIPEHVGLLQLEALADINFPNYLKLPARVSRINTVRYNMSETDTVEYRDVVWVPPECFIERMVSYDGTEGNIDTVVDPSGVKILCRNDKMPDIWTSFDDEYMIFDSYTVSVESTLQTSKALVIARQLPTFSKEDDFIPDMDDNMFPLYINECKSWAYAELKQTSHPKAEQQARRQRVFYQANRHRVDTPTDRGTNFGRRR